jgi:hypothetical protein
VHVKRLPIEVKLDHRCFLMGSCFAENIGARLQGYKFNVEVNPFGISYNPLSLAWNLERLLDETSFTAQDIVTSNGRCFSYKHHSSFTRSNAAAALSAINAAHTRGRRKLLETKVLFLTLGSAYAWRLKESGVLVANCHKQPAATFDKFLVSPAQVQEHLSAAVQKCVQANPSMKVVLTISPVRHWREGAVENSRSKAVLLVAAQALCERTPELFHYFPSYEIMMDDLRDYRFYESGKHHLPPNAKSTRSSCMLILKAKSLQIARARALLQVFLFTTGLYYRAD